VADEPSRRVRRQLAAGPRKGEVRETQILDALERLLAAKPFTELTMDDIARHAGLSRSALYFYFAHKEDALAALHQRTYVAMARTTEPLTEAGDATEPSMRRAIEEVCRNWREHTNALRTFHETAMVSASFGERWRERLGTHVATLAQMIEGERAAGRADPGPPAAEALAAAWFWMLEGRFYELFRRDHDRADEDDLVDTLTVLWTRSIAAR
jgi:AcrR family transcriptional regulator